MQHGRWWRVVPGLALLCAALAAEASGPPAMRKQIELSMLVTGRVIIEPDGRVASWTVDQREALPEPVPALIDRAVPQWRFAPILVEGKPTRGSARMSLRMVARRSGDGSDQYLVRVENGYFGREALSFDERAAKGLAGEYVAAERMDPPTYPRLAAEMGAQGTVYLVLQVDRQGAVADVVVEQVNLRTIGREKQMERMRALLSASALEGARRWRFRPPGAGPSAGDAHWSIRVPVAYLMNGSKAGITGYGQWDAYVPGPRQPVPWSDPAWQEDVSPDTLVSGEVYQAGAALKLLTPIGG